MVVVSDLMRKLAGSRHLDGPRPIGVHEAQGVGQVLDGLLSQVVRLVEGHEVVHRSHAALGGHLGRQEEVELLVAVLILDEGVVEDGARLRVVEATASLEEHTLVDALVHNNKSELGNGSLVAELLENFAELTHFLGLDLLAHSVANTIAEDDNLFGHLLLVLVEGSQGLLQAVVKISLDQLLVLRLDDEVGEVAGAGHIGRRCKPDDRVLARMTDVDTNHHRARIDDHLGQLHSDVLTTDLLVELLHHVGGYRQVQAPSGPLGHHLSDEALFGEDLLCGMIILLVVDHEDDCELVLRAFDILPRHKLLKTLLHRSVQLIWPLVSTPRVVDADRLDATALHTDLLLTVLQGTLDALEVSLVRSPVVHENDQALGERLAAVYGHGFQEALIAEELVLALMVDQLWLSQASTGKLQGLRLDADTPLGEHGGTRLEELVDHAVDVLHLLLGVVADFAQQLAHVLRVVADTVRDAIDEAELRRDLEPSILASLHVDDRLGLGLDLELVLAEEVASHTHLRAVVHLEEGSSGPRLKVDLVDTEGLPLSIAGNDALTDKLLLDLSLEALLIAVGPLSAVLHGSLVVLVVDLVDDVEARLRRHEAVARVQDEHAVLLVHVGRALEALPDLHVQLLDVDGPRMIEKARPPAEGDHALNSTHGLVHDDVEDLRVGLIVMSLPRRKLITNRLDRQLTLGTDPKDVGLCEHGDGQLDGVLQLLGRPDVHARVEEGTDEHLDVASVPHHHLLDVVGRRRKALILPREAELVCWLEGDGVLEDWRCVLDAESELVGQHLTLPLSGLTGGTRHAHERLGGPAVEATAA